MLCSLKVMLQHSISGGLNSCDTMFLLRPPQLANVDQIFKPLIDSAKACGVTHIVFLSVQGAEISTLTPHNKIEHLIVASGLGFTFLRPAYFMQNFSTTLKKDIHNREIYLPCGNAEFALVDVRDVGDVAAIVLLNPDKYNKAKLDLTCRKSLSFTQMANKLSKILQVVIIFRSPNLLSFFIRKKREGVAVSFILILIMLHFFPRFQNPPKTTNTVQEITGRPPREFEDYVRDNKDLLLSL
jgi:NmrA-like family